MREILNSGSGRDREDEKIVVMKWMIAVVFSSCVLGIATEQGRRHVRVLPGRGEAGYLPERGIEALRIHIFDPLLRLQ